MASKKKTTTKAATMTKTTGARTTRTKRPTKTAAAREVEPKVTHEQIARRAYEIWIAYGCPEGQDRAHWYQAERELAPPMPR